MQKQGGQVKYITGAQVVPRESHPPTMTSNLAIDI